MDLTGDLLRGHSDLIVLSLLETKDSYGYEINKTIKTMSDDMFQFTEATLYTTFKRLQHKGYIDAYWVASNTNRKRKYYTITQKGITHLNTLRDSWDKAKTHLERLISQS